jgi:hypothetical protein
LAVYDYVQEFVTKGDLKQELASVHP